MRRFFSLPVLIVAVLALALGSVGTAVAGPALTKGKVKAIAGKVVKKAAPTLSVGHATTASTASTATTATTAGNATNLAGQPASAYLDRVVQVASITNTVVPIGDTNQILGPVTITVPAGVGFVQVSAVAAFATGDTPFGVWFQMDGPCLDAGNDFDNRQCGDTANKISVSLNRVVPVTTGAHTFRLCVITSEAIIADNRVLTAETVALGS
jgi:hypothetical protein